MDMGTVEDIGPTLTHLPPCFSHTQAQIRTDQIRLELESGHQARATGKERGNKGLIRSSEPDHILDQTSTTNQSQSHTTNVSYTHAHTTPHSNNNHHRDNNTPASRLA
jgi:hypothetical protein